MDAAKSELDEAIAAARASAKRARTCSWRAIFPDGFARGGHDPPGLLRNGRAPPNWKARWQGGRVRGYNPDVGLSIPTPASPLSEPIQPRRSSSMPNQRSAQPSSSSPPSVELSPAHELSSGDEEASSYFIQPTMPPPATITASTSPPSAERAPTAADGCLNRPPSCSTQRHGRSHRRPLSSHRRGQARRARRAVDPAVQERAASFTARTAAACDTGTGSKRIYSRTQLLSLRPPDAAALCFVPHSERYSCHARAVRLGLADRGPSHPCGRFSVPSVAAREMLVRVHAGAVPPSLSRGPYP